MATHPKNNEYVRKWRQLNREKYLEYDRKHLLKYYYYKKGIITAVWLVTG